jgi:hypothetical protein
MNPLDALKQFIAVVADIGNLEHLAQLRPQAATANPSWIFKNRHAVDPRFVLPPKGEGLVKLTGARP